MEVGGQRHAPAALPPGKTRYPPYMKLGWPHGRSRQVRKISPPTGIRSLDRPARSYPLYRLSYPGPPRLPSGFQNCFMLVILSQKVLRNQVEVVAGHDDENVRDIRQGKPQHIEHKRLKFRSWSSLRPLECLPPKSQ